VKARTEGEGGLRRKVALPFREENWTRRGGGSSASYRRKKKSDVAQRGGKAGRGTQKNCRRNAALPKKYISQNSIFSQKERKGKAVGESSILNRHKNIVHNKKI